MPVEPLVLGGDDGVLEVGRNRTGRDHAAELVAAPCEHVAFLIQHGDGTARAPVQQRVKLGQGRIDQPDTGANDKAGHQPDSPCDPPDQPENPSQDGAEKAEDAPADPARLARGGLARLCGGLGLGRGRRRSARRRGKAFLSNQRRFAPRFVRHFSPCPARLVARRLSCAEGFVEASSASISFTLCTYFALFAHLA